MRIGKVDKKEKGRLRTLPLAGVVLAGLVGTSVFVSVGSVSRGAELLKIEEETKQVNAQSRELKMEMVNDTSLRNLVVKADEFGLAEPETVVYLTRETMSQPALAKVN